MVDGVDGCDVGDVDFDVDRRDLGGGGRGDRTILGIY